MKSEDDPEARIRELEQPLTDAARASEAAAYQPPSKWAPPSGPPLPPPALPYDATIQYPSTGPRRGGRTRWILLALFVIGVMCLPIAIFLFSAHHVSRSTFPSIPSFSTPGPSTSVRVPRTTASAALPTAPATSVTKAPAGENITVSGISEARTIACSGGSISVSGITNNVTITGHCARLIVSGIQNQISIDTADAIEASGSGNQVTYHGGSPKIGKSGIDNVVQQG
ncbi:DUF3060 domain-containing protein [Candidatus Mycobacterium wuenschmannii]|uniref:DUF3060 domain-containing protein n=1 Tax=Candidatus Mycobacterium wuenschmannii TaxID=3027808 RepID=A0ABY8W1I5_9MYCO|nr:DUF3060 domain-containing protein [Candidatus Mycobacterium wuenschmannii]WIM88874.1 DUF3060 domain-containing protein [Candidatus Mycobacterium wuenschmannii]